MKIFISGPITDNANYKQQFKTAEEKLKKNGHIVMNPAILPNGFEHEEYMKITVAMLEVCDAVLFLEGWFESEGSAIEMTKAIEFKKGMIHEIEGVYLKGDKIFK